MSKIGNHKTHPAADGFPMVDGEAWTELVEDIKAKGLYDPIVLIVVDGEELILDGRNRYKACIEAEVRPRFTMFKRSDPWDWVYSHNLQRRDLTKAQRAHAAAYRAKNEPGSNQHAPKRKPPKREKKEEVTAGPSSVSHTKAAEDAGVSARSVKRAKVIQEKGTAELNEAVRDGKVELKTAERIAKLPKAKQAEAVERIKKGEKPAAVAPPKKSTRRKTEAKPKKAKPPTGAYTGPSAEGYEKTNEMAASMVAQLVELDKAHGVLRRELSRACRDRMPPKGLNGCDKALGSAIASIDHARKCIDCIIFTEACGCDDPHECKRCHGKAVISLWSERATEESEQRRAK